jgi:Domain of unknown function (DUF4893)
MLFARFITFAALLALAGGVAEAKKKKPPKSPEPVVADWKQVVTPRDMDRIRNWRNAFVKALDNSKQRGNAGSMAREGALLDPDASIGGDAPPAGDYRCRVIKIGAGAPLRPAYVVYPVFPCSVADEGEVKSFSKTGGPQRPVGLIFKGDAHRAIFLGTMMLGDEKRAIDYGRDSMRDMAGAVERIGDKRWRLILPYPSFESVMDIIEMVPA